MKTVVVTGAAGFLGTHLSERFLAEGYHIVAVDNFSTGSRFNRDLLESYNRETQRVLFFEEDITLPWAWIEDIPTDWLSSTRYVLHFASPASPPKYSVLNVETLQANSVGLMQALDFADKVKARLIFASTSEIYGEQEPPQVEGQWGSVNSFGERSCYQEAKRFGEALIYAHNKRHKTLHGLVRIFNTYGPYMNPEDGRVLINFLTQASAGKPLSVFGDGSQTRSFCYVSDLVEAVYRYSLKSLTEPVNIGNDQETSILEMVDLIRGLYSEKKLEVTYSRLPQEDPLRRCPDISKAFTLLDGWMPQVSLKEGLRLMKAWYENPK